MSASGSRSRGDVAGRSLRGRAAPGDDLADVRALRAVANRFTGSEATRKRALLASVAAATPGSASVLLEAHDVLLFLLAYPETPAMRAQAADGLMRAAEAARTIAAGGAGERRKLRGSGIAWAPTTAAFSLPIVLWLTERFPGNAELDSPGERGELLISCLAQALPASEFALIEAAEDDPELAIEAGTAGWRSSRLAWLAGCFERLRCDSGLATALFDRIAPFVTVNPRDSALSRTFARGLPNPVHYHRAPLLRDVDVRRTMATALPAMRRTRVADRRHFLDTARGILAMLGRETDPITYADVTRTRCYDLGRGVTIALYSALPERRPALDSHVGYMLFKNSVPIGYGGGWPFLGTCKIGINLFAPFRGGESMFALAAVLRTYAQLFGVERFVVEPYQFGAGNREGLESGAFWFYYRIGFRPIEPRVRALAEAEFDRLRRNPQIRTPLETLRRFTRSDLELAVSTSALASCDPVELSRAVTSWIGARFRGDRERAEAYAIGRAKTALLPAGAGAWNEREQRALRALAPVVAQIPDLERWPARDRRRLAAMIRAKGGDEFRYFRLMDGFARLRQALEAIAQRAAIGP